jgi:hypothetical protein
MSGLRPSLHGLYADLGNQELVCVFKYPICFYKASMHYSRRCRAPSIIHAERNPDLNRHSRNLSEVLTERHWVVYN